MSGARKRIRKETGSSINETEGRERAEDCSFVRASALTSELIYLQMTELG